MISNLIEPLLNRRVRSLGIGEENFFPKSLGTSFEEAVNVRVVWGKRLCLIMWVYIREIQKRSHKNLKMVLL